MEHTPTPWPEPRYDNDVNPGFYEWWEVEGVARFDNEADALFAVHCINSHSSLVEEMERLREALTPSGETKAAYVGEFTIKVVVGDDDGEDIHEYYTVPWTTIKEIMAAIRERANA